jgi:hypothetical protein
MIDFIISNQWTLMFTVLIVLQVMAEAGFRI